LGTGAVGASIDVPNLHAPLFINGHVKEVEQIATNVCATVHPNATALYWITRRCVGDSPVPPCVECTCNVKMPNASEGVRRLVSGRFRTVEGHRSAIGIGCNCRGESNVL
jgi:hypothetical protein